ncbi:helix-turn-helix domain-containing protein [uncultured Clostridium sp.]|uniref:winged helix-turn-helix transcriptional regulator n=1 Tax=uncultured Clostridium sp. TaxID=59620 RepID=UPI002632EDFB|nr:helix-turn-helix domain-containing protein [uncultured Clostridium sp.]
MDAKKETLDEDTINLALKTLTGKWKLKIIWEISYQECIRFNQLERRLEGISSLMLTRRLKELVDLKIVHREQFNEIPPRVEYSLTHLGLTLCPVLHMLDELGQKLKGIN